VELFCHAARNGPVLVPELDHPWEVAITAREASIAERALTDRALAGAADRFAATILAELLT